MLRRSFLKLLGLAPITPLIPQELIKEQHLPTTGNVMDIKEKYPSCSGYINTMLITPGSGYIQDLEQFSNYTITTSKTIVLEPMKIL